MSAVFYLEDKPNTPSLTLTQVLSLVENLEQFSFMNEEESDQHANSTMEELEFIILGKEGCFRGFELSYDSDQGYAVRVNNPSTILDWNVALQFIKALTKKIDCKIYDEEDQEYTIDNIDSYNFRQQIFSGIEAVVNVVQKPEYGSVALPGLYFDIYFDKDVIDKIYSANDKVQAFSDFITNIYNLDAFAPSQMILQDQDNTIFGMYVIQENMPLIMLNEPTLAMRNINLVENNEAITSWYVCYFDVESKEISPRLEYNAFIQNLPQNQASLLDAKNLLIKPLTLEQIKQIFQSK